MMQTISCWFLFLVSSRPMENQCNEDRNECLLVEMNSFEVEMKMKDKNETLNVEFVVRPQFYRSNCGIDRFVLFLRDIFCIRLESFRRSLFDIDSAHRNLWNIRKKAL